MSKYFDEDDYDDGYNENDYDLIDSIYDDVGEAVAWDFTEDEIVEAIRESNYDAKKSISYLLYGSSSSTPSTSKSSKPSSTKPAPSSNKPAPASNKPAAKNNNTGNSSNTTNNVVKQVPAGNKTQTNKVNPSSLAVDLCSPVEAFTPQLNPSNSSESSEITPFAFSDPSPDDKVKEKQKMAFSKKPDKPRKDDLMADEGEKDNQAGPFKYKQNVKAKAITGDLSNMNISATEAKPQPTNNAASNVKMHTAARRKSLELKIKTFHDDTTNKDHLNMVVIGHVDAGKSTTMGHLLYQLGCVDAKLINKYERESQQKGKSSFHFAWVLDEHETERNRGVTINVGIRSFETPHHRITLLDAPGHRDFVPNMISGCAQADVAILMIDSATNAFENGFVGDGQTKEHTMLARSLGVTQLIVAINKLDMVEWDKSRFDYIVSTMSPFLKQAGFNLSNVYYIPCSGLSGENLTKIKEPKLTQWYTGNTLVDQIDLFKPSERLLDKPLRMTITDVYKPPQGTPASVILAGKIETGFVSTHDKICLSPNNHICVVKILHKNHETCEWGAAGDNVELGVSGVELNEVSVGHIVSDPSQKVAVANKIRGQIVVFGGLRIPITPGTPVEFHTQSSEVAGKIVSLVALVDKVTGEKTKTKPRMLIEGNTALVEIQLISSVCIERYKDFKSLARFMLRDHGKTIAAGVVMDIL